MSDLALSTRIPQDTDTERLLLARLLAASGVRSTGVALASAARTATTQSADISSQGFRGLIVYLNVTVAAGVGGLRLTLRAKDPTVGTYALYAQNTTNFTATGNPMWVFYPGAGSQAGNALVLGWSANGVYGLPLPSTFRIEVTHATADSYTYSVNYELIP